MRYQRNGAKRNKIILTIRAVKVAALFMRKERNFNMKKQCNSLKNIKTTIITENDKQSYVVEDDDKKSSLNITQGMIKLDSGKLSLE
jgi:hypothetical protein